jgi:hypothetical protein
VLLTVVQHGNCDLVLETALFVPEYNSYMSACVHHSSNHTFLSRNLNSAAFNYASSEGGGVIGRGLTRYNAQTAEYCSSNAAKSVQAHTALLNHMYASNASLAVRISSVFCAACFYLVGLNMRTFFIHSFSIFDWLTQESIQQASEIRRCIDLSALDDSVYQACCATYLSVDDEYALYSTLPCTGSAQYKVKEKFCAQCKNR